MIKLRADETGLYAERECEPDYKRLWEKLRMAAFERFTRRGIIEPLELYNLMGFAVIDEKEIDRWI